MSDSDLVHDPHRKKNPPGPLTIVTLVLGILSLVAVVGCCIPILNYLVFFVEVVLIILTQTLGFVAISQGTQNNEDTTMAKIGMALALVPLVLMLVYLLIVCFVVVAYFVFVVFLVAVA